MFEFKESQINTYGYILGIIYFIYFQNYTPVDAIFQNPEEIVFAFIFSLPFIIASYVFSLLIKKISKKNYQGVYFLVLMMLFVQGL